MADEISISRSRGSEAEAETLASVVQHCNANAIEPIALVAEISQESALDRTAALSLYAANVSAASDLEFLRARFCVVVGGELEGDCARNHPRARAHENVQLPIGRR